MHVMFGVTGGVAYSPAEFPSITFAARRAQQALGVLGACAAHDGTGR
ncbi:MAG: hypothetical protein R2717_04470 [Schumannella sp.]